MIYLQIKQFFDQFDDAASQTLMPVTLTAQDIKELIQGFSPQASYLDYHHDLQRRRVKLAGYIEGLRDRELAPFQKQELNRAKAALELMWAIEKAVYEYQNTGLN